MSFAHPIFTSAVAGGARLATQAAQIIFREVGRQAVRQASSAVVGLVADTAQNAAEFTLETIEQLSTDAIAALLGVHCPGVNDDEVVRNDEVTNRFLNVLAEREGGAADLGEQFRLRARDFQFDDETATNVANVSIPQGCAIGILRAENDLVATRKFPDGSGAPRRIRQCVRSSTDGQRVSREVHEWEYTRRNQWGDLLAEVRQWGQRALDAAQNGDDLAEFNLGGALSIESIDNAINANEISFNTRDYTFGNFVDARNMRRGIEQLRRVNRSVTGDRFTDLFRLLNINREEVVATINNNFDWGPQFRELLLLGVREDSLQSGNIPADDLI